MEEDMHGGRGPEEVLVLALQGRGHLGSAGMKCTIPLWRTLSSNKRHLALSMLWCSWTVRQSRVV